MDYKNKEISEIIDENVHSERDRYILKRKLIDGITFERLAEDVDMSVRGVRYIVARFKREYGLR